MTVNCPECGGDVPVAARTIPILAGTCPSCSREVVLLSPGTTPLAAAAPPPEEAGEGSPLTTGLALPHPGDDDCEGTLQLEAVGADRLVGVCSDCGEEFTFRLASAEGSDERPAPDRRRDADEGPRGPRVPRGVNARPCRQCGGVLTFETGEDGAVVGHCASCGNTFSLAPRSDRGGGRPDRGGFRRYGGRDFRSGGGGSRGFRGRPPGRRYGGRSSDSESSDDDGRRRRRFRRSED